MTVVASPTDSGKSSKTTSKEHEKEGEVDTSSISTNSASKSKNTSKESENSMTSVNSSSMALINVLANSEKITNDPQLAHAIAQLKDIVRKSSSDNDNTSGVISNDDLLNSRKESNETDIKLSCSEDEDEDDDLGGLLDNSNQADSSSHSSSKREVTSDAMKLAIINESDFLIQDYLKHFLKSDGEPTSQS